MGIKGGAVAAGVLTLSAVTAAHAYEFGFPSEAQKPGLTIGVDADTPPPGLYGFDTVFTYQSHFTGPGAPSANGAATSVRGESLGLGLLWVPGWTFLDGKYDIVAVQPINDTGLGNPLNQTFAGLHNTYFENDLGWKLANSGFFVKAGLGMYVPDGTIEGPAGLSNWGNPWWTFMPTLVVSYLKDGWNLSANIFDEINTQNTITDYTSGQVFHAEFTATKTFGKWTIGPAAYYAGQITNDTSSAFYNYAINTNRFNDWAVGGLIGYDFGPVKLKLWALQEVSVDASGGTAGPGLDSAFTTRGFTAFAQISYRLWAPDEPASTPSPLYHK